MEVGCISLVLVDPVSWQVHCVSDPRLSCCNSNADRVVEHRLHLFVFAFHSWLCSANCAVALGLFSVVPIESIVICYHSSCCLTPFLSPLCDCDLFNSSCLALLGWGSWSEPSLHHHNIELQMSLPLNVVFTFRDREGGQLKCML